MEVQSGHAPGRVNLIGDHTDYNRGLALPVAIDLATDAVFTPNGSSRITVLSDAFPTQVDIPLSIPVDPAVLSTWEPAWSRPVAALVALVRPEWGGLLRIQSTVPVGAGLSSSAALGVSVAVALGATGTPRTIAVLCHQMEQMTDVPVGMMDPLVSAGAKAGHALLIDFSDLSTAHVPLPEDMDIVVVHSGISRELRFTPYGARVAECEAAAAVVGPLGAADDADIAGLRDPILARRTRHVVTECRRVRELAGAMAAGDTARAGRIMLESHRSLAEDFEVSTPELDTLVDRLASMDGVHGARLTGAGFGGCVVAITEPGAVDLEALGLQAWRVRPSDGAIPA
ncbi:MAG: galactokinase [Actinomycetota bacterium]|nr:galactokinase [Actinomycetota bacterium]